MPFPIRQLGCDECPELLREIPDCPKKLSVRGQMPPRESLYLCVVGSRKTTPYGRRQCANLVAGLARAPVPIVIASGLAMGIDAEAHLAAMDAGLKTVALMPSGLDETVWYPRANRALAQQILKKEVRSFRRTRTTLKQCCIPLRSATASWQQCPKQH